MVTITDERSTQYCTIATLDVGDFFEYAESIYVLTSKEESRVFNFSTRAEEHFLRDIQINNIEKVEIILETF